MERETKKKNALSLSQQWAFMMFQIIVMLKFKKYPAYFRPYNLLLYILKKS